MKSYTDLEQSKKLAEILPLESADMYYMETSCDNYTIGVLQRMETDMLLNHAEYYKMSPCWSLAALLEVLPNDEVTSTTVTRGGWNIEPAKYLNIWFAEYETEKHDNDFSLSAGNPIDAAVELMIWLKEKNLL